MKLLVIGRHGQLARCLQERALEIAGIELVLAGRPELDFERPDQLPAVIRALSPDVVLNAAAYTAVDQAEDEPARAWACNAVAPGILAEVTAQLDIPLIQISTDYVFAGTQVRPYREEDQTGPAGVYGQTKLAGEKAVRSANPRATIVRTAWVVSHFGRNFLKTMLALAESREEVAVVSDQHGSPTSALDLADGLLALAARWEKGVSMGQGETYHLAGSGSASWAGVARAIFAEAHLRGLPSARVQPITTLAYPAKVVRPTHSVLNCAKFAKDVGFVMPEWSASIGAVVERCAAR